MRAAARAVVYVYFRGRQAVEDEMAKKGVRRATSRTGRFLENFKEEVKSEMRKQRK